MNVCLIVNVDIMWERRIYETKYVLVPYNHFIFCPIVNYRFFSPTVIRSEIMGLFV